MGNCCEPEKKSKHKKPTLDKDKCIVKKEVFMEGEFFLPKINQLKTNSLKVPEKRKETDVEDFIVPVNKDLTKFRVGDANQDFDTAELVLHRFTTQSVKQTSNTAASTQNGLAKRNNRDS